MITFQRIQAEARFSDIMLYQIAPILDSNNFDLILSSSSQTLKMNMSPIDYKHLEHCLKLAREAFEAGDAPFGSILVNARNEVIAEARNRINEINVLSHPEYELARWAVDHLTPEERRKTTIYTSGEHCPMCSAAHGWAGLGNIVYLSSAEQLQEWMQETGAPSAPIRFHPIQEIIPAVSVKGPANGPLLEEIKSLQIAFHKNQIRN